MKLYEIGSIYRDLLDRYNTAEAQEELDALANELSAIDGDFSDKSRNIVALIREQSATSDAIDAEIKRLTALKKTHDNSVDWLKRYLHSEMEATGIAKQDLGIAKVWLQNNPPSVSEIDETKLPRDYYRIIPETREPDKRRIIEDWKAGVEIDGVTITQKSGLRIK